MTAPTVTSIEVAEHTIVLPDATPVLLKYRAASDLVVLPRARRHPWASTRDLARTWERLLAVAVPRLPLLTILLVLAATSYPLLMSNTAFLDEASYLSAGHVIWHNWMHGGPDMRYSSYFSGSPLIYPLLAAAFNVIGGLAAARLLSLGFVLVTICLLYATTRQLFDRRAATWAALVFATVEGTQFIAALATYDAMALMLTACALWVAVRYAHADRSFPHAALLIGAPILAFANATKYATALFDPVVIAVVALVVVNRYGWKQGARIAVLFTAMVGAALTAGVAIAGHDYEAGVLGTTLKRADGGVSASTVLGEAARWVWPVSLLAVLAAVLAWRHARGSGRSPQRITAVLVTVLAGAAFLAPLEQARIHTTVSLAKHVAFGAWFAAIAAGWLLSQVSGARLRAVWRWLPVAALVASVAVVGHAQAETRYSGWSNSTQLMASLRPYVAATDKPILMDDADVADYYLGTNLPPTKWSDTYFYAYTPPGTTTMLTGAPAYRAAIMHNHFGVVALNFRLTADTDRGIKAAIETNPRYHYAGRVFVHDEYGHAAYAVWINVHPEATS